MPKQPIETKRPLVRRTRSGVFTAHRSAPRSILEALSPIVWTVGCGDAGSSRSEVDIRPIESVVVASARITRNRGTVGAIVKALTCDDAEAQVLELRESSRRVPLLVFCSEDQLFDGGAASLYVTSERQELGSAGAREAIRMFLDSCETLARSQHERVDAFAAWRGLTSAEADLLYRLCSGVRARDMHEAQGITCNTKKERIANIREKCWNMGIEEIADIALNRAS